MHQHGTPPPVHSLCRATPMRLTDRNSGGESWCHYITHLLVKLISFATVTSRRFDLQSFTGFSTKVEGLKANLVASLTIRRTRVALCCSWPVLSLCCHSSSSSSSWMGKCKEWSPAGRLSWPVAEANQQAEIAGSADLLRTAAVAARPAWLANRRHRDTNLLFLFVSLTSLFHKNATTSLKGQHGVERHLVGADMSGGRADNRYEVTGRGVCLHRGQF